MKRWGVRLCENFYPELESWFLRRVPDQHDAQDLVQQLFAELLQRRSPASPRAYIYGIARKILWRYLRKRETERARRHRFLEEAWREGHTAFMLSFGGAQEHDSETRNDGGFENLLDGLSAGEAKLLRMRFSRELTTEKMARSLRCSQDAVRKRLQRVIERLREKYRNNLDSALE